MKKFKSPVTTVIALMIVIGIVLAGGFILSGCKDSDEGNGQQVIDQDPEPNDQEDPDDQEEPSGNEESDENGENEQKEEPYMPWHSDAVDLSWLSKEIPELPEPTGNVVRVTNTLELLNAVNASEPGMTILIAEGTYQLVDTLILNKEGLTLRGESHDRNKVVLLGSGFEGKGLGPKTAIKIEGGANITVANLTISECRTQAIAVQGWADPTPHNVHIYNVGFINIGQHNIKVNPMVDRPAPEGGIIEYCYFEQTKDIEAGRNDTKEGDYVGGVDAHKIKDWIIRDNVFVNVRGAHGGGDAAVFIWNHSGGTIVERNVAIGCDKGIAFGNPYVGHFESYPEDQRFHHDGGIIRNNFIYVHKDHVGIEAFGAPGTKIYNNTIISENPDNFRAIQYGHPSTSVQIYNNLIGGQIFVPPSYEGAQSDIDKNITEVPLDWVMGAENGDMRLKDSVGTNVKGAGMVIPDVEDDFFGNPRLGVSDIGAHQVSGK